MKKDKNKSALVTNILMQYFSFLFNNHGDKFLPGDIISHTVQELPLGFHFLQDKAWIPEQHMWMFVCVCTVYRAIDYLASCSLCIIGGSSHWFITMVAFWNRGINLTISNRGQYLINYFWQTDTIHNCLMRDGGLKT